MTTHEPYVLREDGGAIATLILNRPDKANALSEEMMDTLEDRLLEADHDAGVRVIVIAARGRIFCGGHDLAQMRGHEASSYFDTLFNRCARLMSRVRGARKPVIAKVQGAAVAAGCQLVATCDLAYAADHAKFGVNGIDLGLFCSTPSVALSRAIAPRQALELLLTGRLIDARRAVELGLLNGAVPAAELDETVAKVAALIAQKLPAAVELGKDAFHKQVGLGVEDAYALTAARMVENMGFADTRTLIDGFLAKTAKK